jgi:hypothetical protein
MAYLLTRNSRIEEDLIDQLFNPSERRLARLLLQLAHFGKEGSPQPILVDTGGSRQLFPLLAIRLVFKGALRQAYRTSSRLGRIALPNG